MKTMRPATAAVGRGFERGHAVEAHDFGFEAAGGRRRRAAERGDDHALARRRDDVRLLAQRVPVRNREGLDADVAEAVVAQHAHGPVAGARFGFGAGQARADFGDEALDDVPGAIVLERRGAQALDGALLFGAERRDGGGACGLVATWTAGLRLLLRVRR